jgi:exopolysaccharide biosynthesis polyprenyl glycosylphosphotransferase
LTADEVAAPVVHSTVALVSPAPARSGLRRILVTVDVVALALAWVLALSLTASGVDAVGKVVPAVVLTGVLVLAVESLYSTHVNALRRSVNRRLLVASVVCGALAFLLLSRHDSTSAIEGATVGATFTYLATASARFGFESWLERCRAGGRYLRPVVLIGAGSEVAEVRSFLEENPELGYEPCGLVGGTRLEAEAAGMAWLGPVHEARSALARSGASGAIVLTNGLPSAALNNVVRQLSADGVHIHLSTGLLGLQYRCLRPVPVAHEPFLYVQPVLPPSRFQLHLKRLMDIAVASLILLLVAPVMVITAIAIWLQDRGPILFRQTRVGRDGRPITVHKFRTMVPDAESQFEHVRHLNERDGPLFKASYDPRITRLGAHLRSSSIDELPQLFDVLRGDMSLVGPRPALPAEAAQFDNDLAIRTRVRPGLTGLWQIEARDKPGFSSYRRLDLFYVENWSLGLDLSILASTVPIVAERALRALFGRGGRSDIPATAGERR